MGEATASEEAVVGVDELRVRRVGDVDGLEAAEPLERLHLTRDDTRTPDGIAGRAVLAIVIVHRVLPFP